MSRQALHRESRIFYTGGRELSALFMLSFCFLFMLNGCIYEEPEDCSQGINIRFYSKTSCSIDTVYPEVSDLKLCVFDRNGLLVSYQEVSHVEELSSYIKTMEVTNGLYTIIAWAGIEGDAFSINEPVVNSMTRNDPLFRLRRAAGQALSIEGKRIYYGESSAVSLPDPSVYGSVYESVAINLQEITNRVTVRLEGLPEVDNYQVMIESANGSMNIDGSIAPDETIDYYSTSSINNNIQETSFTLLKLATGYNSTLVIKDKQSGHELYRGDLLGTLLLKNPHINLSCDHDFVIRFTVEDPGTYMNMEIRVNEWLVNNYSVDL